MSRQCSDQTVTPPPKALGKYGREGTKGKKRVLILSQCRDTIYGDKIHIERMRPNHTGGHTHRYESDSSDLLSNNKLM